MTLAATLVPRRARGRRGRSPESSCVARFFAKRGLWVYALALLPALVFFGHGLDAKWRIERLSPAAA